MANEECKHCSWEFAEPGLAEAVLGSQECINCGRDRPMDIAERLETIQNYEQRLHVCERNLSIHEANKDPTPTGTNAN